jgi:hypothetical protein
MNNQNRRLPIIAILLTLGFSTIMMYVLIEILSLPNRSGGVPRIVFSTLNCLIFIGLASLGNLITRLVTAAAVIQLWFITMLYTVLQFGAVFIGINTWYGKKYILYQLIVLFFYLCVALPVLNISYRKKIN